MPTNEGSGKTYRIQPHQENPEHLDELVIKNAHVHLEQLDDHIFMLIVENEEQHIHMRVGSRTGRGKVDAWIVEQHDQERIEPRRRS